MSLLSYLQNLVTISELDEEDNEEADESTEKNIVEDTEEVLEEYPEVSETIAEAVEEDDFEGLSAIKVPQYIAKLIAYHTEVSEEELLNWEFIIDEWTDDGQEIDDEISEMLAKHTKNTVEELREDESPNFGWVKVPNKFFNNMEGFNRVLQTNIAEQTDGLSFRDIDTYKIEVAGTELRDLEETDGEDKMLDVSFRLNETNFADIESQLSDHMSEERITELIEEVQEENEE